MKKQFEVDYEKMLEIKEQHAKANKADDGAGKKAAQTAFVGLDAKIKARGKMYSTIYCLYESAQERGNEHIDLSECYEYSDETALITCFREYGIETFTFSSHWSSAVESAWIFVKLGCTLKGMVEINSKSRKWDGEVYEKCPAYLFSVNG